jgi:hypothetical protein
VFTDRLGWRQNVLKSKDAENVNVPLMSACVNGARKRTLAAKTVYHNGSIDTSFVPPLFSLDITFNKYLMYVRCWLTFA